MWKKDFFILPFSVQVQGLTVSWAPFEVGHSLNEQNGKEVEFLLDSGRKQQNTFSISLGEFAVAGVGDRILPTERVGVCVCELTLNHFYTFILFLHFFLPQVLFICYSSLWKITVQHFCPLENLLFFFNVKYKMVNEV